MKKSLLHTFLVSAISLASSNATVLVLDFEGVGDNNPVGNFYNGGAGTNYSVSFTSNALALVDSDAGGSGNFGGESSPSTILFFTAGSAVMNVPAGFTTGFSFFYSAIFNPGFVNVYDGLDATGNLLATLNLPVTTSDGGDPTGPFSPFFLAGVAFSGTAQSVDFGGTVNQIGFDDITIGSAVPEPSSSLLSALAAAGFLIRRRRNA